jgi:hypothetical protein
VEFLIFLAILAVVVVFVTRPLLRGPAGTSKAQPQSAPATDLADLEAAREAKYREIRDAELDHRTGKLSHDDFRQIDRSLRAEAIEILRARDGAWARQTPSHGRASDASGGQPAGTA